MYVEAARDFERAKAQGAIGILISQQNSEHFRTVEDVQSLLQSLGQRVSQAHVSPSNPDRRWIVRSRRILIWKRIRRGHRRAHE